MGSQVECISDMFQAADLVSVLLQANMTVGQMWVSQDTMLLFIQHIHGCIEAKIDRTCRSVNPMYIGLLANGERGRC